MLRHVTIEYLDKTYVGELRPGTTGKARWYFTHEGRDVGDVQAEPDDTPDTVRAKLQGLVDAYAG
jgi:hypothetical protein